MIVPTGKPKLNQREALNYARSMLLNEPDVPILIGLRGYYKHTMGDPEKNDRNIYDDAIVLLSPTAFASFNANTDPSITRKGVAVLKPGEWTYQLGKHGYVSNRPYPALVQGGAVTVHRDEKGDDTGWFGINIHRGGRTTTSSLGCQTIYPDQWQSFYNLVEGEMHRYEQKYITYYLVEL